MKLTRKRAIELCIELWTWCAKTGKLKEGWPKWDDYEELIDSYCWFCYWNNHTATGKRRRNSGECCACPYLKKYGHCNENVSTYFFRWHNASTPRTRKKYAKLFLGQIKELK